MNQTYYTILTKRGAALLANATALGVPLKITQMSVGDGNGKIPKPDANQTQLVHEVRRAAINTLFVDKENPNQIIAEQVIPESDGGWFIHEIGLFDDKGNLIAVGNCPATYKPKLAEGSGRTQVIRMVIIVDNTQSIELKIDPAVVLATRKYVDDLITAKMTAHEKSTNHPNATTSSKGFVQLNSSIDSNLENQASTPIAVKKVNDNVNYAHARINDVHEYAKSINNEVISAHNRISQVHNYSKEVDGRVTSANNRITNVNEYAKSINNEVISAHNRISQVHDYSKVVSGRVDNIADKFQSGGFESRMYSQDKRFYQVVRDDGLVGMYSLVKNCFSWSINHDGWIDGYLPASRIGKLDEFVRDRTPPVGVPMPWPQVYPPAGYFECNGSTFDKNKCPKLAAAYPSGILPDLRGEFIRGWDNARGADPYRVILDWQQDTIRNIYGRFPVVTRAGGAEPITADGVFRSDSRWNAAVKMGDSDNWGQVYSFDASRVVPVAHENRPRNIAFMYIVKAE
ncbi:MULTISPECIES: phage tail protein [unclassified Gilliamella]|uniref:phage tail protein n=1 Tax=unclassified Gilliamella TaxID=2685620 RepID=UPI000A33B07D|nr:MULTISPECIES: phage tail protein [unclassified Gilliamella]OTQ72883.1 hypothetical protein B6C99_09875 [Gilliamella sp. N-G2]OTQ78825.1 hypothetical protein B6D23_07580 [Gilliamella sp. N-W3]